MGDRVAYLAAASSNRSGVVRSRSGGYSYVPSKICYAAGPSVRCPTSSKKVPRWQPAISPDWNRSTGVALTAYKTTPSFVLNSSNPPSVVGILTHTVRLPQACRVDQLIRCHRLQIASFCIILVILDAQRVSPCFFAVVKSCFRNRILKCGLCFSSRARLRLHT